MNLTRRYKLSLINNTLLTEKEYEILNDVQEWILGLDSFMQNPISGSEGRLEAYVVPTIEKLKSKYKDDISGEDLNEFFIYILNNNIKRLEREIEKDKE